MRKQKQKYLHDPENGQTGDCYRTALAILLDMNRDDAPHWVTPDNWKRWAVDVQPKYDAWLAERGLKELPVPLNGEHGLEAVLSCSQAWWGNTPAMLTGESRSGCNHVVIIQDGEIVCDPSTTDAGIIGPCNDGFFWITALIPVNPPAMLAAKAIQDAALTQQQEAAPVAYALVWPSDGSRNQINSSTVFDTQEAAEDYRGRCSDHHTISVTPLYLHPPMSAAQPTMDDAIATGNGTLHGAIDYWQERALKAEAAQPQVPEGCPSDIEVREAVADFMKDTQTLPLEDCAKLLVMRIKALLAAAKEEGK